MNWIRIVLRRFLRDQPKVAELVRQREASGRALARASLAIAEMQRLEKVARDSGR